MSHARMKWNGLLSSLAVLALLATAATALAQDTNTSGGTTTTTTTTTGPTTTTRVERVTTTVHQTQVTEQKTEEVLPTPKVAIFVKNRANAIYDEKVPALADLVSAYITDLGYSIIDREDAINAVASFASEGANAGDPTLPGADLDALLSNNTSATRLAQNLGADYILTASIVSLNHNAKHFEGYGVARTTLESVIRVSYKILDNMRGGSVTGGVVTATVKSPLQVQASENDMNVYAESTGVVDELLDAASQKITEQMAMKQVKLAKPVAPGMARWTVICGTTNLLVPTIVETPEHDFVVGEQKLPINPMNVTIELNGVVIGTAPGTFDVPPGLSKLRLSREGYNDFEGTVNVADGQTLRIDLSMTDAEYLRWKDMTAFLEILKTNAKLTDAQEEAIRGYAQMLRQSGYRVDYRANTTEGIRSITNNQYLVAPNLWAPPPTAAGPVQVDVDVNQTTVTDNDTNNVNNNSN